MPNPFRKFFNERMAPVSDAGPSGSTQRRHDPLHIAACALLLELAHADDQFSAAERDHIHAVLMRHFALDYQTAQELMELADQQRQEAPDIFQFANLVRTSYDIGQKTVLAEIMWGLILTDGEIARHEGYILRKIANLLDLEPGYLSQAKATAAAKIAQA